MNLALNMYRSVFKSCATCMMLAFLCYGVLIAHVKIKPQELLNLTNLHLPACE